MRRATNLAPRPSLLLSAARLQLFELLLHTLDESLRQRGVVEVLGQSLSFLGRPQEEVGQGSSFVAGLLGEEDGPGRTADRVDTLPLGIGDRETQVFRDVG